jgi:prevent-host-death family protein
MYVLSETYGKEIRMTRLAASKAREDFSDTLNRVAYGGERIVLRRRGRDLAAIVPMEDLALIEKIEDETDVREARRALARMKRTGRKPVPLEKLKRDLGL